ncbi:MAG: zinc ribbon domain-containing protein [Clostridiales bacterium]|nr:zinc ribbon domain-containing protein [Clostridiales bacterium]
MARETTTVQCYPDDKIINDRIKQYEAFGWELINNQRCQEYEGQTSSKDFINGGTTITRHYSTFNKLTFSRDKNAPWYNKAIELEKEHNRLLGTKPSNYAIRPSNNWLLGIIGLPVGIMLLFMLMQAGALIVITCVLIVVSVLFLITYCVKRVRYKNDNEEYYSKMREWENTVAKQAEQIRIKSEAIVNGEYVEEQAKQNESVGNGEQINIFCTKCGAKNNTDSEYCIKCGQRLIK